MTDSELMERAAKAGYDYRKVYGSFPDRIGIHWVRLRYMTQEALMFPEPPPHEARLLFLSDVPMNTPVKIGIHRALLEPVKGVDYDEVYLLVPELPDRPIHLARTRSGEAMARMAKSEFEVIE